MEVVSKGYLSGCDKAEILSCENMIVNNSDFRTADIIDGVWYVNKEIRMSQIKDRQMATKDDYYDAHRIITRWGKDTPVGKKKPFLISMVE